MYGKKRVVLSPKVRTICGRKLVSVKGGGGSHPIGFWYETDGRFYADLKSDEQWYQLVNNHTIANKGLGGFATQAELRTFVMNYWLNIETKPARIGDA